MKDAAITGDDFKFAETTAARMLAQGLARASEEQGLSIRSLGKRLGYKQAVVLSHMANGRTPIPIDRAEELADALKLDKKSFLEAVLTQRHPMVSWQLLSDIGSAGDSDGLAQELEAIMGERLGNLSKEQRAIIREVAAEPSPRRRWLSIHEIYAMKKLRETFPDISTEGIDPSDVGLFHAIFPQE